MDIQRLADIVGADGVLTGDDVRARSVSWADHSPCQALAIVRPANTEQVSRVLDQLQTFDPPGLFGRSLSECLAIQLYH